MRRVAFGVVGLVGGYVLVAALGALLLAAVSSNRHDKDLEVAMTAVFVFGPIGGLVGLVAGAACGGRR